jgi:hypothetical protein
MIPFLVYSVAEKPGLVLRTGASTSGAIGIQAQAGEAVIRGDADPATQMVADGTIVPRPASGLAMEVEVEAGAATLVEVPEGAKVRRPGDVEWQIAEDGLIEVELVADEVFLCHVRPPWPVMEYLLRVHAA